MEMLLEFFTVATTPQIFGFVSLVTIVFIGVLCILGMILSAMQCRTTIKKETYHA